MEFLTHFIEAALISFNLTVFAMKAGKRESHLLPAFTAKFLLYLILYLLFFLTSFFPGIFFQFRQSFFSIYTILVLAGLFYITGNKHVFASHLVRLLLVFQFYMLLFSSELFDFGVISFYSPGLASPYNPVPALMVLFFQSTVDENRHVYRRNVATVILVLFLCKIAIGVFFKKETDVYFKAVLLPFSFDVAEILVEDTQGVYVVKSLLKGVEVFYKYAPEPVIEAGIQERQIFRFFIAVSEFPVIEQSENRILAYDLTRKFMGKFQTLEWSNGGLKITGPVF